MLKPTAAIIAEEGAFIVQTRWKGAALDQPMGLGFSVGDMGIAERLTRAINAGVVFEEPQVARNHLGKTYVSSHVMVNGRSLNADLKRLGF